MLAALALAAALGFPAVPVRDLEGRDRKIGPEPVPVVYLVGFTHESRHDAAAWRREIVATQLPLPAYEVPVLSGVAVLLRPVIEGSMARKTPPADRAYTLITTERDRLVDALRLQDPERDLVVALVDTQGTVSHVVRGAPTPAALDALLTAWRGLRSLP